ncbi:hypothetical protein MPP7335_01857 [Mycolicibacterium parafortuitum]|uniref:Uncharacterized protein n=1 Tax=Mycolicibacterium parafortuitum TaxID=39692 RepID=A0A375YG84_MYCPF|nr:hypothetical protein MPP7335_01857 [Mycolicibacterium parafortuitum]
MPLSARECSRCGLESAGKKKFGLCGKCSYEDKYWVKIHRNLRNCYRMHGFETPRASHSDYLAVVAYYWGALNQRERERVIAELVAHGYSAAQTEPFEALADVLIGALRGTAKEYWRGTASQSVHTVRGGLPGLGRRS